jgi:hypothetical protein
MLTPDKAAIFARCRALASEAARAARLEVFSARAAAKRPERPLAALIIDEAAVPPRIVRSLQKAICAIERHDRTSTPLVCSKALPAIS